MLHQTHYFQLSRDSHYLLGRGGKGPQCNCSNSLLQTLSSQNKLREKKNGYIAKLKPKIKQGKRSIRCYTHHSLYSFSHTYTYLKYIHPITWCSMDITRINKIQKQPHYRSMIEFAGRPLPYNPQHFFPSLRQIPGYIKTQIDHICTEIRFPFTNRILHHKTHVEDNMNACRTHTETPHTTKCV